MDETKNLHDNKAHIHVTAAIIRKGGKILITRRPVGRHLEGLWEFPGGKQEGSETLEQCIEREIKEELDMGVRAERCVLTVGHEYDTKRVELHFFECDRIKGTPRPVEGQEVRWVSPGELKEYKLPPPDKRIIDYLISSV